MGCVGWVLLFLFARLVKCSELQVDIIVYSLWDRHRFHEEAGLYKELYRHKIVKKSIYFVSPSRTYRKNHAHNNRGSSR